MSIRFQCPSCNEIRSANSNLAGKVIRCPACSANVQLPTLEALAAAEQQKDKATVQSESNSAFRTDNPADEERYDSTSQESSPTPNDLDNEDEPQEEPVLFAKNANRDNTEMDMTPMVDVTFLLLIFFMITASFSIQKVFRTPAQKSNEASTKAIPDPNQDNSDSVIVQIDEFNAYTVLLPSGEEREVPSKQDLIVLLSENKGGESGPQKLVIKAHADSLHSAVVAALDAGRDANFERFELTTIEDFE
jgi:biopolymer transport protein ExbD